MDINDPETRALRSTLKKLGLQFFFIIFVQFFFFVIFFSLLSITISFLPDFNFFLEEQMLASERALEENAKQIELERKIAAKKKQDEEESSRARQKKHDDIFIAKMMELENAIKKGSGGISEQQIKQLEEKYKQGAGGGGGNSALVKQMEEMKERIAKTEATLKKEQSTNSMLHSFVNKDGGSLADKDGEIENLKKTTGMILSLFS